MVHFPKQFEIWLDISHLHNMCTCISKVGSPSFYLIKYNISGGRLTGCILWFWCILSTHTIMDVGLLHIYHREYKRLVALSCYIKAGVCPGRKWPLPAWQHRPPSLHPFPSIPPHPHPSLHTEGSLMVWQWGRFAGGILIETINKRPPMFARVKARKFGPIHQNYIFKFFFEVFRPSTDSKTGGQHQVRV